MGSSGMEGEERRVGYSCPVNGSCCNRIRDVRGGEARKGREGHTCECVVEPIMWSTDHTYKAVHRLHQAVGLTKDLGTGTGLLQGYNSLGKSNNLFFALGLIGRIELEDGIKDSIETQASGTMTVAYS